MGAHYTITEFLGDGIGPELSAAVHTLGAALPIDIQFDPVDLSLANRQVRGKAIYDQALASIERTRVALKYPTVTAEESPNAILRRLCNFTVIHRPVWTIPGVPTNFRKELNIEIVRVATGGTYDDPGRMIGLDGAVSLRIVERQPCLEASRYAFALARKTRRTSVTSASKYTIQRATDGLFQKIAEGVAAEFADITHHEELFDALLAKIVMFPDRFEVILVLNEYGDFLSDMACGLAGSMGIGASASLSFDASAGVRLAMFDPAGGTAPDIAGQDKANPTAMFLATAMALQHLGEIELAGRLRDGTLRLLHQGIRTADLGGDRSLSQFTGDVIEEVANPMGPESRGAAGQVAGIS